MRHGISAGGSDNDLSMFLALADLASVGDFLLAGFAARSA